MKKSTMSHSKHPSKESSHSSLSTSPPSTDVKSKIKGLFRHRHHHEEASAGHTVVCKNVPKTLVPVLSKRQKMRESSLEMSEQSYPTDRTSSISSLTSELLAFEQEAETFEDYTHKVEEALTMLSKTKREDYESPTTHKILRFLENLIHQPKDWISGAKLKLSERRFPEMAMTLMNSYKEKGYLVRRDVFVHSILLYNSMSNFTDHEFDKEGLLRKQSADAGFIEFACDILNDTSYRESVKKCYVIQTPEETTQNDDFNNYQKILYICDSALTILYNLANLPEVKLHFRECNAMTIIAEYTKLPSNTIQIHFPQIRENEEYIASIKELQEIASAIRVTSCLLLPLIMNEDEDNLLAANTSEVLPVLSGMIQRYNKNDQRFYGFSFIELVDGLSKLMVRGRTHSFIDQNLVNILLNILKNSSHDNSLLECVSNAILNASFDENVQTFLESDHAIRIIKTTQHHTQSQLVQKNCDAILWTLNQIPHKPCSTISNSCQLQGHIMISYNRSATPMCLKMRDRLKSLNYGVWLDVDNINGGVLESMAQAVEESSIVLICMNEQYKQSYYCRLEAEYATELRKPCIPCLMQPRFRPYGWLGIIKGAKIHVDFATLPFEEAFALLIREVETIRKDVKAKTNVSHITEDRPKQPVTHQSSVGFVSEDSKQIINELPQEPLNNHVELWTTELVKDWLDRSELSHLSHALINIDGKLLGRLYKMKQTAANSYFQFLDKYFDRLQIARMSDILKFDYELECLFQSYEKDSFIL